MPVDPASARHQLAILACRKAARVLGWPRDWRSHEVLNPSTGQPFTDAQAWDFVAALLQDASVVVEEIQLESPPDKTGFVIRAPLNARTLYVKIQLGAGKIIGRSFHYSEHEQ